jgi:ABC-2 type transport system ATP-binding protein
LPVATYSAGMQTRLAFAVATSLEPEILIADEAISTGDAHFMSHAQKRMAAMMERSSIFVLATHSLETLQQMCNRAILLEHGRIVAAGGVDQVAARYVATSG